MNPTEQFKLIRQLMTDAESGSHVLWASRVALAATAYADIQQWIDDGRWRTDDLTNVCPRCNTHFIRR